MCVLLLFVLLLMLLLCVLLLLLLFCCYSNELIYLLAMGYCGLHFVAMRRIALWHSVLRSRRGELGMQILSTPAILGLGTPLPFTASDMKIFTCENWLLDGCLIS